MLGCVRAGGRLFGHSGFVARVPSDGTIVESLGSRPLVTHNRIVGRLSIAWARQVTVLQSFCGVDVSKDWFDVFGPDGSAIRVPNTAEGIGQIAALCRVGAEVIVVSEASGGVEWLAFHSLWELGIAFGVLVQQLRQNRTVAIAARGKVYGAAVWCGRVHGGSLWLDPYRGRFCAADGGQRVTP